MSTGEASGAGRRLTPEEEQRGAELFAQGLSTRAVAAQLGIGNGTAARLKRRLERAAADSDAEETTVTDHQEHQAAAADANPGPFEMTPAGPPTADEDEVELLRLCGERDDLATTVVTYEARAQASRQAVAQLEAERIETLAAGRDAQPLRTRRRDAEDDARDSDDAAGIARGQLTEVCRQIAAIEGRQADRLLRAELAEAVAERDVILAAVGERQRLAVLAVRTAAEEFTAALADELAVLRRVDDLAARIALGPAPAVAAAMSTALSVPSPVAAQPVALARAISEARIGNVAAVARQLGEACGWLPPDPAALAVEAERRRQLAEEGAQAEAAWRSRSPQQAAPVVRHLPEHLGSSVSVDSQGNPLRAPDPEQPRPQQVVRPGSLGFEPRPR